jgi:twinkle protein
MFSGSIRHFRGYVMKPEIDEIKRRLNARIDEVVRILYPDAKMENGRYRIGNIDGANGDSMVIWTTGDKIGKFEDYASPGDYGDLIDLWIHKKGYANFSDAIGDIKAFVGIADNYEKPNKPKPINISKLVDSYESLTDNMISYLKNVRGFSDDTIRNYKLKNRKGLIVFPFYHEQSVKMYKTLKVKNGKNQWGMNAGDKQTCLFGWQAIKTTDRHVVITEGEIDCMSYHDQGIPALSVPNGAGAGKVKLFMENEHERLMNHFNTFYISMDMDKHGEEMVPSLIKALGAANCRIIELPDLKSGKKSDGNQCHIEGIKLKDFLVTAKYQDVKGIINCSDAFEDAMKIFEGDEQISGHPLPWEAYVDKFRFRPSEMTIWGGYNGSGKTMVVGQLMLFLGAQDISSINACLEMTKGRVMWRSMVQCGSGFNPDRKYAEVIKDYLSKTIWLVDKQGEMKPDELLEKFAYAVARYNIEHLVIDPLAKCGFKEDDYSAQKKFVEQLTDFVHEHGVHLHLIAHARKGERESTQTDKMSIKGSGGMTDMTDNLFLMNKNVKKKKLLDLQNNEGLVIENLDKKERRELKRY